MLEMDNRATDNGNAHQHTNNVVVLYAASVDVQNMKKIKTNQRLYPSPQSITILIQIRCAMIMNIIVYFELIYIMFIFIMCLLVFFVCMSGWYSIY